jgi:hypothetical protein
LSVAGVVYGPAVEAAMEHPADPVSASMLLEWGTQCARVLDIFRCVITYISGDRLIEYGQRYKEELARAFDLAMFLAPKLLHIDRITFYDLATSMMGVFVFEVQNAFDKAGPSTCWTPKDIILKSLRLMTLLKQSQPWDNQRFIDINLRELCSPAIALGKAVDELNAADGFGMAGRQLLRTMHPATRKAAIEYMTWLAEQVDARLDARPYYHDGCYSADDAIFAIIDCLDDPGTDLPKPPSLEPLLDKIKDMQPADPDTEIMCIAIAYRAAAMATYGGVHSDASVMPSVFEAIRVVTAMSFTGGTVDDDTIHTLVSTTRECCVPYYQEACMVHPTPHETIQSLFLPNLVSRRVGALHHENPVERASGRHGTASS